MNHAALVQAQRDRPLHNALVALVRLPLHVPGLSLHNRPSSSRIATKAKLLCPDGQVEATEEWWHPANDWDLLPLWARRPESCAKSGG